MKKIFLTLLLAVLFITVQEIQGQKNEVNSLTSYIKARQMVEKSLTTMGFSKNGNVLQNFTVEFDGELFSRHQGASALPPYTIVKVRAKLIYDDTKSRLSFEDNYRGPEGFGQNLRRVRMKKGGFDVNYWNKTVEDRPNVTLEDLRAILDRFPHLVLQRILERPADLRWGGQTIHNQTTHNIVYAMAGAVPVTLFFDDKTSLLSKYERLMTDPYEGDVIQERAFEGYRQVKGFVFPGVFKRFIAEGLNQDYRFVSVDVNSQIKEDSFTPPAEFQSIKTVDNNSSTSISEIAPGVFFLQNIASGNNHMLFVEFEKEILVVEAINDSGTCERAIELIKKRIPNKPIRYVVPTHHHDDHAGGLRAFIAEGTTIITSPKNKPLFDPFPNSKFTLQPDRLTQNTRPAIIETISNQKRVISDGKQTVEIYDIGVNPHTEEMLVVYFPNSGILFQGDIYNELGQGKELFLYFADWLKNSKLKIKQIVGTHLTPKTIQEFEMVAEKLKGETSK